MISLNKKSIEQIRKIASDMESNLSQHEKDVRRSGFTYMNCREERGWNNTLIFAEEFINFVTFQKLFYVQYWTQAKWWKEKTFDNKELALEFYGRMKRRFIDKKVKK